MLKTSLLTLTIIGCYAIASELEYRDHVNMQRAKYENCITDMSRLVYTDSEIQEMIYLCESRTGHKSDETP